MPETTHLDYTDAKLKIHLIDHSNWFGMGKFNGISLIVSKFHSHHFSVAKFDPIRQSKRPEHDLNKLPVSGRPLISKILNRFAAIPSKKFDRRIEEIQDLLSSSQQNRVYEVLGRQRDIAKRHTTQEKVWLPDHQVLINHKWHRNCDVNIVEFLSFRALIDLIEQ